MGRRGPPPKPTTLKQLEGNPGKRKLPDNPEPTITPKAPTCPTWVCKSGKKVWRRCAPVLHKLGLLTEADNEFLAAYCQCYGRFLEAEAEIDAHGLIVTATNNKSKVYRTQNPACRLSRAYLAQALRYGARFGLSPSDRASLGAEAAGHGDDPLTAMAKAKRQAQANWRKAAGA